jgi:valyl-tRNA synthetase
VPSAVTTLRTALSVLLRLLAPFVPFVTEEAWSWWRPGSVHRAPWPDPADLLAGTGREPNTGRDGSPGSEGPADSGTAVLDAAASAIAAVRRAKSQARLPMKAPAARLILTAPQEQLDALAAAAADVSAAGRIGEITLQPLAGIEPVHEVLL